MYLEFVYRIFQVQKVRQRIVKQNRSMDDGTVESPLVARMKRWKGNMASRRKLKGNVPRQFQVLQEPKSYTRSRQRGRFRSFGSLQSM